MFICLHITAGAEAGIGRPKQLFEVSQLSFFLYIEFDSNAAIAAL